MDNAKIHEGEMVRELIEQAGAKLIYLPPYSPEFSPSDAARSWGFPRRRNLREWSL
ncbi:MAG: hypothetical protein F6K50_50945 [Moorea sp. SIO3I7]|nr:hypothetical protein [Moorena sp. SIO3I7]NEO07655.1 hypothetical protein [Moorena sp. SIO3I8]NEO19617.1 hypothetical protein [Moorena sp. SIO4A5]NEO61020.1 hypothetical protein [Moorena sp. SIO4G2]NEQ59814.1 hypothetical protein [Moorena sp. SIO4A1]